MCAIENENLLEKDYKELVKGVYVAGHPEWKCELYKAALQTKYTLELVDAIEKSSAASEKHARKLTFATWILACATFGLILATLINAF